MRVYSPFSHPRPPVWDTNVGQTFHQCCELQKAGELPKLWIIQQKRPDPALDGEGRTALPQVQQNTGKNTRAEISVCTSKTYFLGILSSTGQSNSLISNIRNFMLALATCRCLQLMNLGEKKRKKNLCFSCVHHTLYRGGLLCWHTGKCTQLSDK